jgi:tetratricopeptide (TPR) repeat protein
MKIAFDTSGRRGIAVVIVILLAGTYLALVTRDVIVAWLGNRIEQKSLQRAAWLDPGNAEFRDHLGRYYDLVVRDPSAATGYYREAVQLNPHSARYWFDLASSYQVQGDTTNQTSAIEHAIEADSMTPDVAWEAANLYLVRGDNEKALREFRVVMSNDASLDNIAIQFCWRIEPDVDALLRDAVPDNADAYVAFLTLLESKQETAGTFKVWDALIRSGQSFEVRHVHDYFAFLVQHKEVDQAVLVWQQAADHFGLSSYLPTANNLVVNPTFSLDVLNFGLDWQYAKQAGVTLSYDDRDFHAGRRSLLIAFDGPGITDAGISQLIPVHPNTTYDLSAYYKNGEMEGAGGPHLTVQDMYSQTVYYDSDELKQAGFWKSVEGKFTSGPECKLVVLHVRRLPEGSPIRGKLWIDDIHITQEPL